MMKRKMNMKKKKKTPLGTVISTAVVNAVSIMHTHTHTCTEHMLSILLKAFTSRSLAKMKSPLEYHTS